MVVGVGGFLALGENEIAVPAQSVNFVPQDGQENQFVLMLNPDKATLDALRSVTGQATTSSDCAAAISVAISRARSMRFDAEGLAIPFCILECHLQGRSVFAR